MENFIGIILNYAQERKLTSDGVLGYMLGYSMGEDFKKCYARANSFDPRQVYPIIQFITEIENG